MASGERVPPHRLPELMDARDCDRRALADALTTFERVNRYLGGARLACRQVYRLLDGGRPGAVRLLDVGAGGGDVAVRLSARLDRAGWSPSFILADRHDATLGLCRDHVLRRAREGAAHRFSFVRLDGAVLPFADGDVDIAFSTTTLHHLEETEARAFVAELARVSRLGWVITDLRRSRPGYALMRALGATVWRGRLFPRADAPVSVLRSFTPAEAGRLAAEAGCPGAVLERSPLRWALRGVRE
jgi:ubiquinone/menaquinone biosynthesis C-methylase UbiE